MSEDQALSEDIAPKKFLNKVTIFYQIEDFCCVSLHTASEESEEHSHEAEDS